MPDPAPTLLTAFDFGVRYNEHVTIESAVLPFKEFP